MTTRVIQRTPDLAIKIKLQPVAEAPTQCAPAQVLDDTGAVLAEMGCGETYTCPGGGGGGGCPCEASLVWMRALPYRHDGNDYIYMEYQTATGGVIHWRDDAPVTGAIYTGELYGDWPAYELWAGVIGAHPAADIVWDYAWDGEDGAAYAYAHADVIDPNTWQTTGVSSPTAQVAHGWQSGTLTITATVDGVALPAISLVVAVGR